jgi:hypothetical protein
MSEQSNNQAPQPARLDGWVGWSKHALENELRARMAHFYGQTDGTMKFPSSAEGDLLKMVHRLLTQNNDAPIKEIKETDPFYYVLNPDKVVTNPTCGCRECNPNAWWMVVCSICGNKRCPHGTSHEFKCTNSNEPGQPGSVFSQKFYPNIKGSTDNETPTK